MKQFNLDEYLKNPSRKVVTRDGRDARIVCTDRKSDYNTDFPIVALVKDVEGTEWSDNYTVEGKLFLNEETDSDLFFAPEKKEGWINIFKSSNDIVFLGQSLIFESKEDAEKGGKECESYATTIKIEWEE